MLLKEFNCDELSQLEPGELELGAPLDVSRDLVVINTVLPLARASMQVCVSEQRVILTRLDEKGGTKPFNVEYNGGSRGGGRQLVFAEHVGRLTVERINDTDCEVTTNLGDCYVSERGLRRLVAVVAEFAHQKQQKLKSAA